MAPRKRAPSTVPVLEEVPRALRQAIVKLMADKNLDWIPACEEAAVLIESNGKEFQSMVKREANSIYKSQFMSAMNEARNSMRAEGWDRGYLDGLGAGKEKFEAWYYCSVCGEKIAISQNSDSHKAVIEYMKEHGWGHKACHEKNN